MFSRLNSIAAIVVETFIVFQILATKSLYKETNKVYKALKSGDIKEARKYLSYLVTRDCDNMKEEDIVVITSDSIHYTKLYELIEQVWQFFSQ